MWFVTGCEFPLMVDGYWDIFFKCYLLPNSPLHGIIEADQFTEYTKAKRFSLTLYVLNTVESWQYLMNIWFDQKHADNLHVVETP